MASWAPIVHVVFFVAFLLAATAVAGSNATVANNAAAMALRRSTEAFPAAAAAHNGQYTCYLCRKRSSLMIRRCPVAQDDCHLNGGDRDADDCYVMKVFPDGSWVVVDVVGCKATAAACYLECGDCDEHGTGGPARNTPATPRGQLPHGLPEFERCGGHLTARGAAVAGV
ncbi:LOW QUALITY PROTEIN: hypothetical protein PAHAL_9G539300 [Panicum hallii]|uniref:Uncharacterized protein n=1 Tax=Panicum hallii TaxID=206008 RepID=A0A2T8I5N4_9POAL|nr:LOW QUALITY PROTEIN: hypothetical protein PAHAL_9G539300 [Panicum hallii]